MASSAIAGVGTQFKRWSGSTWVAIAEINSITGPGMTKDTIDVTSLDSIGGYREFIPGFKNAGTVSLSMNMTQASVATMLADFDSPDFQNYEIQLHEAGVYLEFEGFVTEMPLTIPPDDKVTMDVTIQISGPVNLTSASGSG
jgi:predicted secreted protein